MAAVTWGCRPTGLACVAADEAKQTVARHAARMRIMGFRNQDSNCGVGFRLKLTPAGYNYNIPPNPSNADPACVREALTKSLASPVFSNSARMSRFLQLAVERTLEQRGEELKEYVIGVEVFDRPPSFDPRIDPIVRVEARRLRAKLKT